MQMVVLVAGGDVPPSDYGGVRGVACCGAAAG
jgi:hypothetical protein